MHAALCQHENHLPLASAHAGRVLNSAHAVHMVLAMQATHEQQSREGLVLCARFYNSVHAHPVQVSGMVCLISQRHAPCLPQVAFVYFIARAPCSPVSDMAPQASHCGCAAPVAPVPMQPASACIAVWMALAKTAVCCLGAQRHRLLGARLMHPSTRLAAPCCRSCNHADTHGVVLMHICMLESS